MNRDQVIKECEYWDGLGSESDDWYSYKKCFSELTGIEFEVFRDVKFEHAPFVRLRPDPEFIIYGKPIFLNSKLRCMLLKKIYGIEAICIGNPFMELRRKKSIEKDENAKGTILFPVHSTDLIKVKLNWIKYIEKVKSLPDEYQPISVCLYFKEILNGVDEIFLKEGISVYCAGHYYDPEFFMKFYNILKKFKYSSSNSFGSYALYSIEMGIPFFLFSDNDTIKFDNVGGDNQVPRGVYALQESSFDKYFSYSIESEEPTIDIVHEIVLNHYVGKFEITTEEILNYIEQYRETRSIYFARKFSDFLYKSKHYLLQNKKEKLDKMCSNTTVKRVTVSSLNVQYPASVSLEYFDINNSFLSANEILYVAKIFSSMKPLSILQIGGGDGEITNIISCNSNIKANITVVDMTPEQILSNGALLKYPELGYNSRATNANFYSIEQFKSKGINRQYDIILYVEFDRGIDLFSIFCAVGGFRVTCELFLGMGNTYILEEKILSMNNSPFKDITTVIGENILLCRYQN